MNHPYFSTHTHSIYSVNDAMATVPAIVAKVAKLQQPGLAITDHGTMGGVFQLYKHCKTADIKPFPGIEAYMVDSVARVREAKSHERYHLGLLALDLTGYKALVQLTTHSSSPERFYHKPLIDYDDLSRLHDSGATDHIACMTGCYFGLLNQTLVTKGPSAAEQVLRMFAQWFPHLYVEIQNHNIERDHDPVPYGDYELALALYDLANQAGLPVLCTQDAHYLEKTHQAAHGVMKSLAYGKLLGEDEFPGDGYHVASTKHVADHYTGELAPIWAEAKHGYLDLLDRNDMHLPLLDNYRFLMPKVVDRPKAELRKLVRQKLVARGIDPEWTEANGGPLGAYAVRAKDELGVICDTGFAAYFLMVADVCDWARQQDIRIQTRGSANGSLVCFLIGISDIDPIEWGLTMGGFLTRDRSKPPDIDLDCQQLRRDEVIAYVQKRFPCYQQGTPSSWGFDEETGKGSLFVQYLNSQRRALGDAEYKRRWGDVTMPAQTIREREPELYEELRRLNILRPYKAVGAHAAGFVLDNPKYPLAEYVPMGYIASSKRRITQIFMDDLEEAGYVKLDILGLRTLETVDRVRRLLGWTWQQIEGIPLDDREVFRQISRTQPDNGTFQLEGYTTAKGARTLAPKTIGEVIDVVSMFRPGVSEDAQANYLRNRRRGEVPSFHPIVDPILASTWGEFLYTEQVLEIARAVELEPEDVQSMLKAMKVKHGKAGYNADSERRFKEAADKFVHACFNAGMSYPLANELWDRIVGFNRYAFKKAHATPYGLLAYRTAWLRWHYPAEFYVCQLDVINITKPEALAKNVQAARQRGVRILQPMVNLSGASWTLEGQAIRRGLASIKGVGQAAAEDIAANGPYSSLAEMSERCSSRLVSGFKTWYGKEGQFNGVMAKLCDAGALQELGIEKGAKRQKRTVQLRLKVPT